MQNQTIAQERKQWTDETNLTEAQKLKQQGNEFFTKKEFKQALKKYHRAILHLAGIIDKDSAVAMYAKTAPKQISASANSLKFSIWLNMSQIYIYQQKYDKGLQTYFSNQINRIKKAEQLLEKKLSEETKKKSLPKLSYRKGVCFMKLNYFPEAKTAFDRVKQLDQGFNKEIEQLEKEIKQREKQADQKAKKLYQGFFK